MKAVDLLQSLIRIIRGIARDSIPSRAVSPTSPATAAVEAGATDEPSELALGTDADGNSIVLDFTTGAIRHSGASPTAGSAATSATLIQPQQLTPPRVASLLRALGYEVTLSDGLCLVSTEIGTVRVWYADRFNGIRFTRSYFFKDGSFLGLPEEREGRVCELNAECVFARFAWDGDRNELTTEYELPALPGVAPAQIGAALRQFTFYVEGQLGLGPRYQMP